MKAIPLNGFLECITEHFLLYTLASDSIWLVNAARPSTPLRTFLN